MKLNYKYDYLIAMILALGFDGKPAFKRDDIMEYMPKDYASEVRDNRVVIRTPGMTPVADEGYGTRTDSSNFATRKKSRVRMHYEFQIDIWLRSLDSELAEMTLSDQVDFYVAHHDFIKDPDGETVEVEFLGGGLVEDENDDFYKVVLRIKFIENKYRTEHVPLLPAADQIEIGVTT